MKEDREKILYSDSRAASYKTNIEGWVSKNGRFYGNNEGSEHLARWDGCDLIKCKVCGLEMDKCGYTVCQSCREDQQQLEYFNMPEKEWDGIGMIYSETLDLYLDSIDEALEEAETFGIELKEMLLVICDPTSLREISEDYFCDDLPEDGELPDIIREKLGEFNQALADYGPVSWYPGKYRVKLT